MYLNIAKCHEDLRAMGEAEQFYRLALPASSLLADDGYDRLIRNGIMKGPERIHKKPGPDNS